MAALINKQTTPSKPMLLLMRFREVGIILFTILLIAIVSLFSPSFLTIDNFRDILLNISILAIVCLGQMMVIITTGIDLSVGSVIGLVAMMSAFMIVAFPGLNPVVVLLLGMVLGAVLGSINGAIVAWGGVPPIIATLGTLSIYRGMVFLYSQGTWINAFEMPEQFRQLSKGTPLGVPNLILIAVAVVIAVYYFLNFTQAGRNIYAVGSNEDAANVAGVRVQHVLFMVYVLSGLLSGMAGVLWASRFESAQTNTALGFELQTVAAPVVGGVNIFGGSGTVLGAIFGAFLLGVIENSLTMVRISPFWQLAIQGVLILLAVIVDSAILRRIQNISVKS